MRRIHLIFAVASLSIAWTSCEVLASEGGRDFFKSKTTYVGLDEFVEKYVGEDLKYSFYGFTSKWGISGAKFSNFKSQLDPCIGVGILEKVTCNVTLIPQEGVKHYVTVAWSVPDDMPDGAKLSEMVQALIPCMGTVTNVLGKKWCEEANRRAKEVEVSLKDSTICNVVKAPFGMPVKDFTDAFSASVYRAKDEEGVYHPLKITKLQYDMVRYDSRLKHALLTSRNPDDDDDPNDMVKNEANSPFGHTVLTEARLRELGGVPLTKVDEVRAVKEAYSTHVREFAVAFDALVKMAKEYDTVEGGEYVRRHMAEEYKKRLRPEEQKAEQLINEESRRQRQAQREVRRCQSGVRAAKMQCGKCRHDLADAERAHTNAVLALERARMVRVGEQSPDFGASRVDRKPFRRRRGSAGAVQKAEKNEAAYRAKVESARGRLEMAETAIVAAEQELEKVQANHAAAEADSAKAKSVQEGRIKALSEEIAQEVYAAQRAEKARLEAGLKASADQLEREWNALAVPSRPTFVSLGGNGENE